MGKTAKKKVTFHEVTVGEIIYTDEPITGALYLGRDQLNGRDIFFLPAVTLDWDPLAPQITSARIMAVQCCKCKQQYVMNHKFCVEMKTASVNQFNILDEPPDYRDFKWRPTTVCSGIIVVIPGKGLAGLCACYECGLQMARLVIDEMTF